MGVLSDGKKFRLWSIFRRRGWFGTGFDRKKTHRRPPKISETSPLAFTSSLAQLAEGRTEAEARFRYSAQARGQKAQSERRGKR
jgi:hypothetical protein